jgi:hypothetical protein
MIYLDFFSGSHGHFLEYVINTWLYKGSRVPNIFTEHGSCHLIRKDTAYMAHRIVEAAHYTEFDISQNTPTKLIRISVNNNWANWIYQINVMSRAGDIPLEKKIKSTPESVRHSPSKFRNEWYAKFNSTVDGYPLPDNWRWSDTAVFEFGMESLFDLVEFYNELYLLAEFLEITFVPDQELSDLLEEFLTRNQGWQYYKECKHLVHAVIAGNNIEFSSNEISQALINSLLSKSVGIFDGELFDNDSYPTTTCEIWNTVDQHLKTFDQRF